jgi:hypothetical protein
MYSFFTQTLRTILGKALPADALVRVQAKLLTIFTVYTQPKLQLTIATRILMRAGSHCTGCVHLYSIE